MTKRKLSAGAGIVTYWTTGPTDLAKLTSRCLAIDADLEKYLPKASTPMSALRQACEQVFPGLLVRTLNRDGFAIVQEDRGEEENEYNNIAAVWFDGKDSIDGKCTPQQLRDLRHAYRGHRGILQPAQAGAFLSRVVGEYLGGTMLRPKTGGVYWLPADRAGRWEKIGEALEESAVEAGGAAVYTIHHKMDESAVRAVRDALVHEVSGEAERIMAEVTAGELGEKALQTREREAAALIAKVERYEGLLDTALADVRASLGEVKSAAAAAALVASTHADQAADAAAAD